MKQQVPFLEKNETTGAIFGEESALDGKICNFSV